MIRWVTREGQFVECRGWPSALEALPTEPALLLSVEVGLPESADATADNLAPLARALASRGTLRVQCADPRAGPRGAGTFHSERILAAGRAAGLGDGVCRPVHLREREFLASCLGYPDEWLGMEHSEYALFGEVVLRKPAGANAEPRIRIGLITFDLYFRHMYESPSLEAGFDIRKTECRPFAPPDTYRDLIEFRPDFLFVFRPDYFLPETLRAFRCPIVGFATEPLPRHQNGRVIASEYNERCYQLLRKVRGLCDRLYHYDEACLDFLRAEGFPVTGLFPPCVCTDVYRPDPAATPRWDALLIGKSTERRERYLGHLHLLCRYFHAAHGLMGAEELLPFLQRSRMGLNIHRDETPNLEPRLFLHMASGLFTLTEELPPNPWLREGEHYAAFRTETEFVEQVRSYLAQPQERARMAAAGREWAVKNADALGVWSRLAHDVLRHGSVR